MFIYTLIRILGPHILVWNTNFTTFIDKEKERRKKMTSFLTDFFFHFNMIIVAFFSLVSL